MLRSTPLAQTLGLAPALMFLVPSSAPLAGDAVLATDYGRQASLEVEITRSMEVEVVSMEIEIDGEVRDMGGFGGGTRYEDRLAWRDLWRESDADGLTLLVREFGELEGTSAFSMRDEEREDSIESPFSDAVVEYRRGEDGPECEVTEGDADEDAAAALGMSTLLDGLLPGRAVEVDESWEVDGSALLAALALDAHEALFPTPEVEDDGEGRRGPGGRGGRGPRGPRGGGPATLLGELDWEVELTRVASDDEGRIVVEVEAEGSGEPRPRGGGFGGSAEVSGEIVAVLSGELVFDAETRTPLSLSLEGDATTYEESVRSRGEMEIVSRSEREATLAFEVSFTFAADED